MRPPFRLAAWACSSEALAPALSPCALAVEFVRSCHNGFWRFFAARPDVITPGRYFFVPDRTPHLGDFHYFGCQDWQEGDMPNVTGVPNDPPLGNVKRLGWYYDNGKAPAELPAHGQVGQLSAFDEPQTFPVPFERKLIGGIDSRCFRIPAGALVNDFRILADDNCAWLLLLAGMLNKLESNERLPVTQALQLIFGLGTTVDYRDADANNNLVCVAQTPRNNIILLPGTHSWELLARQLVAGMEGPTNFGQIATLPIWFNAATVALDFANTAGVDWNKPTLLVGHSMGASTALVAWFRLLQADVNRQLRVITFGMPKPGDSRLVSVWSNHGRGTHVVNHGDNIPYFPPSNQTRAAIQSVLPWVPSSWFGSWFQVQPVLFIDAGGRFHYVPLSDLDAAAQIGFIVHGLFFRDEQASVSHRLPSYIRHLKLHCPFVEPPFTAEVYDLLFGHHVFGPGGGEWLPMGGMLEREPMGLVMGGEGVVTIPPGDSCETALELALGEVYAGTTTNGDSQWFKVAIQNGNTYSFTATVDTWADWDADWYYGDDCATKTLILSQPTEFDPCVEHTATADQWIFVAIAGSLFGDTDYTIVLDEGGCP